MIKLLAWALLAATAGCCTTATGSGKGNPQATSPAPGGAASAAAAVPAPARPAAPPSTPPATPEGCRACKGVWAVHGIASGESCVCRTTDGGKRCRDGADCQGMCIAAEDPDRDVVEKGPPARGYFIGRCSDLVTVFGCNRIVERGAAAHGPVVLGEPPQTLCVD